MSVVRIEALAALAALIRLKVPEVAEHVCVGTPAPNEIEAYPNVSIMPSKWAYEPEQAHQARTLPGNRVVYHVGDHTCGCVVSVMATSPAQRNRIEAKILDLFLGNKHPTLGTMMPGVLLFDISSMPELGGWRCSFDLESDEWSDTLALDRRYESRIMVRAEVPALTVDSPVYTIEELILGVTHDLDTQFTPSTAIPPAVELVQINEDGSISNWTP